MGYYSQPQKDVLKLSLYIEVQMNYECLISTADEYFLQIDVYTMVGMCWHGKEAFTTHINIDDIEM
jgi:hypothetical protein